MTAPGIVPGLVSEMNRCPLQPGDLGATDVSCVIVSFNTRQLLAKCLDAVLASVAVSVDVFVVDNHSSDGSAAMVRAEYPNVRLFESDVNLGFAGANNIAFPHCRGRYVLLLNSDAFVEPDTLCRAVEYLDAHPKVGIAGARLVGMDGAWQPSARSFPSLWGDFFVLSGLSHRFPKSRLFGFPDRTWASPDQKAEVDWVVGAFVVVRSEVLRKIGGLDTRFFLYYEEVDWCRRAKAAGYAVHYLPSLRVVHAGGESSKTVTHQELSATGKQLVLWRNRSAFLYYRRHHGSKALGLLVLECGWHAMRALKNWLAGSPTNSRDSRAKIVSLWSAWRDTKGGRVSPKAPW